MVQAYSPLASAIQQQLGRVDSCSLDELATKLPDYSWAQVFAAVDRLTGEGVVTLWHPAPFHYLLSLAPANQLRHGLWQDQLRP